MHRALSIASVLVLVAGSAADRAERPARVEDLFTAAKASSAPCPDDLTAFATTASPICGTSELPAKSLRRKVKAWARQRDDVVQLGGAFWRDSNEFEVARFFVDRELYAVRLDPRDGSLAVIPDLTCFSPQSLVRAGVVKAGDSPVAAPEVLERVNPEYPVDARRERANGFVMVQAIVDTDGSVARGCVLYGLPEGLGFRKEALRAVKAQRYRAGSREGQPVAVMVNESVTWSLGPGR